MCGKYIFHDKKKSFMNRATFAKTIYHSWDTCIYKCDMSISLYTLMTCKHVSLFIETISRLSLAFPLFRHSVSLTMMHTKFTLSLLFISIVHILVWPYAGKSIAVIERINCILQKLLSCFHQDVS